MTNTQKKAIYKKWQVMDHINDLQRNNLSHYDYEILTAVLKALFNHNKAIDFINGNVKTWLEKQGIKTREKGIGYIVAL